MTEPLGLNADIERDIVGLCVNDVSFFVEVHDYLKPSHFTSDEAAKSFAVIKSYFDLYHVLPKPSIVKHQLSKLGVELDETWFVKDSLNADYLRKETVQLVRHQEMKAFIFSAINEVEKGAPDYGKLEEELRRVINIQPQADLGTFYWDLDERFARMKAVREERLPTGIPFIDKCMKGGLGQKELVCFAAPPGFGKSLLLTIVGSHVLLSGRNVAHYTFEMSEEMTSLRYDSAILNRTSDQILEDVEAAKEKLRVKRRVIAENLVVKEYPTRGGSVATIRAHLQKAKEQKGFVPDLIIVDYGDIMKAGRQYQNRYEEQGAIFQELRGLAQEMKIPVLSATQTNRGSMSKEVAGMEDLGDSFDKARIMDALFMMLQKPEEREEGLFRLYGAKVRNGTAGKMAGYEIEYETVQIREVGEVEPEE